MNALLELSQKYAGRADRIVKRHTTEEGVFDADFQPHVDYYRDAAANVARLAEGLEDGGEADFSGLKVVGGFSQKFSNKVSTRDKAATPQELIEKANA